MNKLLLLLCLGFTSLYAMEETYVLVRTYSTNVGRDILKSAIMNDDKENVQKNMGVFPSALDRQYGYLGLATSPTIKKILANEMYIYWYGCISESPKKGLNSFFFDFKKLKRIYTEFDYGFVCFLSSLRSALLKLEAIKKSKKLKALVEKIPEGETNLMLETAYIYGHKKEKQEVCEDLKDLIEQACPKINPAFPLQRIPLKSSL